jgi:hypothetical protein
VNGVAEFPTADIWTGLLTVAPDFGLHIVTEGGADAGVHPPVLTVTVAVSLLVPSATLVATT